MGAKEAAVIVRDFAFEKEDPRFVGLPHPDEGKRRSEMSEQEEEEGGEGEEFSSSGGGCTFPFPSLSRTRADPLALAVSWGFVTSHQTDFPAEDDSQIHSEDETAGEFVPGIYAAIYDFEPELETEMKMSTGDVVTVFSRQCAGWVRSLFLPQCPIELIRASAGPGGEDQGWGAGRGRRSRAGELPPVARAGRGRVGEWSFGTGGGSGTDGGGEGGEPRCRRLRGMRASLFCLPAYLRA